MGLRSLLLHKGRESPESRVQKGSLNQKITVCAVQTVGNMEERGVQDNLGACDPS